MFIVNRHCCYCYNQLYLLKIIIQSVTAFGRLMIEQTKQYVEEMFTIKNGYEHDAKVINRFFQNRVFSNTYFISFYK